MEQPPPLEPRPGLAAARTQARTHLLANLVALPGLGSILARRKIGWLQAPLALTGFALTLAWFASFVREWVRVGEFPGDGGPRFRLGLVGVGLFVAAWFWALATGLRIVRESRCQPPLRLGGQA